MKKFSVLFLLLCSNIAYSQVDSLAGKDLFDLSLEELMNISITSASRKEESSFDAPLTTCVITRQDIANTGATSVPDALKICPAIIVRERFNGAYDVSIRGGVDGLPAYGLHNGSQSVLVMINNRPVFNALSGGTFWQNLPIVLTDIERIEVVEGPAAPLFGPNAVNGIINIISKDFVKDFGNTESNIMANANIQSSDVSNIVDATASFKVNEKVATYFSVNNQSRKRYREEYYDNATYKFISDIQMVSDTGIAKRYDKFFPERKYGLKATSFNTGINYTPDDKKFIDFNIGYNENVALYALNVNSLTISSYMNRSLNAAARGRFNNFSFLGSVLSGAQYIAGKEESGKYDYHNIDGYIDYDWQVTRNLNIKPAVSIQTAQANDIDYTVKKNKVGVFNNKADMVNYAASVKADYSTEKFRAIAAVRADGFSFPKGLFPSYQLILNYKPNNDNIFRVVAGRSYGGSFLSPTFINTLARVAPTKPFRTEVFLVGNKDRDIRYNDSYEVGYRTNTSIGQFDLALFSQNYGGFSTNITQAPIVDVPNQRIVVNALQQDIPLKVNQLGATISATIALLKNKVSLRPHLTVQKTKAKNYSPYNRRSNTLNPADTIYVYSNTSNITWKGTPDYFGGFTLQAKPMKKVVVSLSAYFRGSYYLTAGNGVSANGALDPNREDIFNISSKDTYNLYLGYDVSDNFRVYFNGKNIFQNTAREDVATDRIGAMYLFGVNYGLK